MPDDCQNSYLTASLDCARACLGRLCADGYTEDVVIRTRTWSGPPGARSSTYTDVDETIEPRPRVAPVPLRYEAQAGGKHARGTRRVSGVSLTYAEADLVDHGLADNVERFYLIGDKPYLLASEPVRRSAGWTFDLARRETGV